MAINLMFDANRIKSLRDRLGLTQRQFADEVGVAQPTVANWETGIKQPEGGEVLAKLYQLEESALGQRVTLLRDIKTGRFVKTKGDGKGD